jgi:hypothetical protein
MISNWTLSNKDARAICGSLSRPSKMPGHAYSLPPEDCRIGSLLQQVERTVCFRCYALRGRYVFAVVRKAMRTRLASLSHPRWVEAITALIRCSGDRYFRWHDAGDIQSLEHLKRIIAVCNNLPRVKFWLPTREYQTVEAYRRMGGDIPANLCIRYSAHIINGRPPLQYGLPVSTVFSDPEKAPSGAHCCRAATRGNHCGRCRACWNPLVEVVNFPLK